MFAGVIKCAYHIGLVLPCAPHCRSSAQQGVRWVFTINCPSFQDALNVYEALPLGDDGKDFGVYGGAQIEIAPTTGQVHVQGWCGFEKGQNRRLSAMKKICARAHWEVMRGKISQNVKYCSKSESSVSEYKTWGDVPEDHQGKRTDLDEAAEMIISSTASMSKTLKAVAERFPGAYVKFNKGFHALAEVVAKPAYLPPVPEFWKPWQLALKLKLEGPADDRKIVWIRDTVGGKGKSTLSKYFCAYHSENAIDLNGKINDMRYAYAKDPKEIVFFDVSRTTAEHMMHLYAFAEELKNGKFMSGKFDSKFVLFKPPHVVFMSNSMYEVGRWSADRVELIDLDLDEVSGGAGGVVGGAGGGFASESMPVPSDDQFSLFGL